MRARVERKLSVGLVRLLWWLLPILFHYDFVLRNTRSHVQYRWWNFRTHEMAIFHLFLFSFCAIFSCLLCFALLSFSLFLQSRRFCFSPTVSANVLPYFFFPVYHVPLLILLVDANTFLRLHAHCDENGRHARAFQSRTECMFGGGCRNKRRGRRNSSRQMKCTRGLG